MRAVLLAACVQTVLACSGRDEARVVDAIDAAPPPPVDAALPPDAPLPAPRGRAGTACDSGDDCAGGTCLGVPGGPQEGNLRFAGGFCSALGCVPESQQGCGPDEWCVDGSAITYCVPICSNMVGISCERADHVCLGLGNFGGCFSAAYIECNSSVTGPATGCPLGDACVRVGFEDPTLGRCEPPCDPLAADDGCAAGRGCYYIARYDAAFCTVPGTAAPGEACECDRCCVEDLACVAAPGQTERRCVPECRVADGCPQGAGTCQPLVPGAMYGGCVL